MFDEKTANTHRYHIASQPINYQVLFYIYCLKIFIQKSERIHYNLRIWLMDLFLPKYQAHFDKPEKVTSICSFMPVTEISVIIDRDIAKTNHQKGTVHKILNSHFAFLSEMSIW